MQFGGQALAPKKVKICAFKENVRLTNGLLKVDVYVLTFVYICFIKKALTVDVYVLTVVYICFIKKALTVDVYVLTVVYIHHFFPQRKKSA